MGIGTKTVDQDFQFGMASEFLERFLRLDEARRFEGFFIKIAREGYL